MESIKTTIIKYLEGQGRASKSKIEKEVGELTLSTGDCIARRMRELVASDVLKKVQREFDGKKYWEYSVVKEDPYAEELDEIQEDTTSMEEKIEQIERLNL